MYAPLFFGISYHSGLIYFQTSTFVTRVKQSEALASLLLHKTIRLETVAHTCTCLCHFFSPGFSPGRGWGREKAKLHLEQTCSSIIIFVQVTVHSGFLAAYDAVKPQVFLLLDAITHSGSSSKPWKVYVTGHSLGRCTYNLYKETTQAVKEHSPYWMGHSLGGCTYIEKLRSKWKGNPHIE